MRFSIRDLMWMTLAVALSLGWWFSLKANEAKHDLAIREIEAKRTEIVSHARRLQHALELAKSNHDFDLIDDPNEVFNRTGFHPYPPPPVDWSVLDEPIPAS